MNCLLNNCTNECVECNWEKWYYGRCNGCGNCFDKENWIYQRDRFEASFPSIDFDNVIIYYVNDGFIHKGNGVCFECAESCIDDLSI